MKMFKNLFSRRKGKLHLDIKKIRDSIESTHERILIEQEEIKESVRKANEEIECGVRPPGKRFRL